MNLRPYQLAAVDELRRNWRSRPILVAPTGSGKTIIAVEVIRSAVAIGNSVLFLAHREELIRQAAERMPFPVGIIMAENKEQREFPVQVASVQTLINRESPQADVVIVDECFPAGTLVDGQPIEALRVGDVVATGLVTRTFRSRPTAMVRVIAGGRSVACTPGHPFLTARGWIQAGLLRSSDVVLCFTHEQYSVRAMRRTVRQDQARKPADFLRSVHSGEALRAREVHHDAVLVRSFGDALGTQRFAPSSHRTSLLLARAQEGMAPARLLNNDGRDESDLRIGANAKKESDGRSGCSRQNANVATCDGMASASTRWERKASTACAATPRVRAWVADGGCDSDTEVTRFWLSNLLQSRHRQRDASRGDRSRRTVALLQAFARREERQAFAWTRVDRVEVLEQTGDGTFGGVCSDGYVYNLEVSPTHVYCADGFVVHNCHHSRAGTYRRILEAYPRACLIGLTATPFRLDGKGLGDVFGAIVLAATPEELIAEGFILRPIVYQGTCADLSVIKKHHGDFAHGGLSLAMNQPKLVAGIVEQWMKRADGRTTVVFASSVDHSKAIAAQFIAAGIAADHIDGTTSKEDRRGMLARIESGELTVISNYGILTEGWDLPRAGVCVLARPTFSLGLYLQMVGRVLRPYVASNGEAKPRPLILDHADCTARHGFCEEEIEYNLDDKIKKPREGNVVCKTCLNCGALVPVACLVCPECGAEFPPKEVKPERKEDLVLVERVEVDRAWYAERIKIASHCGYKIGWARYQYQQRYGNWPRLFSLEREYYQPVDGGLNWKNLEAVWDRLSGPDGGDDWTFEGRFRDVTQCRGIPQWKHFAAFGAWIRAAERTLRYGGDPFGADGPNGS